MTEAIADHGPLSIYEKKIEVRWADCDANQHMRHTAYADFCAHTRVAFFSQIGLTPEFFHDNSIGPVIFKEETEYCREAHMGDLLTVTVEIGEPTGFTKSVQIVQKIYKGDGELSALHRCTFAWMDLNVRKIIPLPEPIKALFPTETREEVCA